jgi:hypothetical protein
MTEVAVDTLPSKAYSVYLGTQLYIRGLHYSAGALLDPIYLHISLDEQCQNHRPSRVK